MSAVNSPNKIIALVKVMVPVRRPAMEIEDVTIESLLVRVTEFAGQGARFVTATCLDRGSHLEVFYHFDHNMELSNLRLVVPKGSEVPSISLVYLCAFIVENEMKELFGLNITGLAVDYHGKLLLSENSPKLPMLKTEKPNGSN